MNRSLHIALTAAPLLAVAASAQTAGWRTDGTGRYPDARPPAAWSAETNVVWKTKLPAWSNATPAPAGDRLFLCAEPATLIAVAAADGAILWERTNTYEDIAPSEDREKAARAAAEAPGIQGEIGELDKQLKQTNEKLKETPDDDALKGEADALRQKLEAARGRLNDLEPYVLPAAHGTTGYSSPTPVTDGRSVYALFGTGVAAAYDRDGNRRWARLLEKPTHGWGHSASPLLAGGLLVVHVRHLHGLDPETGETRWTVPSGARWGALTAARAGDTDLVVTAHGEVVRAADGTVLAKGLHGLEYCAPVVHEGVAYFIEHGGKAFRLPAATGDGGETPERLWTTEPPKERYYASPVVHEGLVYAVMQHGVFSAIEADTGTVLYSEKLPFGGTFYPSVTLAGGLLYVSSDNGTTAVLRPGRTFEQVAVHKLEPFRACPVFIGNRVYVRGLQHLYCLGE